jgi:hypothetical protein
MGRRKKITCPCCGAILKGIDSRSDEWICINDDCPENETKPYNAYAEFYGATQEAVNKMAKDCHLTLLTQEGNK